MANFTVTTNATDDARLDFLLTRENRQRATQGLPAVTLAQAVQVLFRRGVEKEYNSQTDDEHREWRQAYVDATQATKDQIRTLLGL